jgi:heme-degrading monooxygenase HmoA
MYIAMNRFKVIKTEKAAFENVWLTRESRLDEVPGFISFHMLKGPEREDHVLYSSHTIWASEAEFLAWTKSEQFRAAHKHAGGQKPLTIGHPEFEGFEVIQTLDNPHLKAQTPSPSAQNPAAA